MGGDLLGEHGLGDTSPPARRKTVRRPSGEVVAAACWSHGARGKRPARKLSGEPSLRLSAQTATHGSRRMLSLSARAAWVHAIALAKIIKPIKDLVALQVAEW